MTGQLKPDHGKIDYQKATQIAWLSQEIPAGLTGTVYDIVLSGLKTEVKLLKEYHEVSHRLETEYSESLLNSPLLSKLLILVTVSAFSDAALLCKAMIADKKAQSQAS